MDHVTSILNIENLTLIEKKISIKKFKKEIQNDYKTLSRNSSIVAKTIYFIDSLISKFAFSFNKVILESFYFPKKEYLKICLRCKLIPSKYQSFFDYKPKEKKSLAIDVRIAFKDLLSETKIDNKFVRDEVLLNLKTQGKRKLIVEIIDRINKNNFTKFK